MEFNFAPMCGAEFLFFVRWSSGISNREYGGEPPQRTVCLLPSYGRPFFLSFLYALTRAANAVPELRRRLLDGQVVEFDRCCPSYTAMKDSGVYVYCLVDSGLLPYEDFLTDGKRRQAEALKGEGLAESGDPLSNFFVSCVPWLAYTQLKHPVTGPEDTNPRFSWGKFTEMNGRVTMPVTVFVNHALADGLHIARFYENLDQEPAEIVKQIKNS